MDLLPTFPIEYAVSAARVRHGTADIAVRTEGLGTTVSFLAPLAGKCGALTRTVPAVSVGHNDIGVTFALNGMIGKRAHTISTRSCGTYLLSRMWSHAEELEESVNTVVTMGTFPIRCALNAGCSHRGTMPGVAFIFEQRQL